MCKKIFSLFLLVVCGFADAQEFELGNVTKAELEEKSHPLEPGAEAAILYEVGKTWMDFNENDGFSLITEVDVRIKIYSTEGYDWANKSIPFYIGNNPKERVEFSRAVTYNLVDGKIEKTKLKSDGEFLTSLNKFWSERKIAMPNVKEGSIVEFRYAIKSPYLSTFPTWNFQNSIPVNYSKYITRIPEFYVYNPNMRGYFNPRRDVAKVLKNYQFTSKIRNDGLVSSTSFEQGKIEYNEIITTYICEKLPAMKEENYVNNIKNYTASIEHELAMTKFPNSAQKNLSLSWDDVVKNIYDSADFGDELKKTGYFESDLNELLAGANSQSERVAVVFNYVKNKMNWNNMVGYSCDSGVKQAYKTKTGNVAEINLMLTAMLRHAGLKANPVLVSTRANGISIFPNRTAFNYVIAAIEIDNDVILLDATDQYSIPNILPVRVLNWNGRLIRSNGTSASVDLEPKSNSKDIVNILASIDTQGKVTGKIREQHFDYKAFVHRASYNNLAKDNYLEKLEKEYSGIEIGDYESLNNKDLTKPIVENYSFQHNSISELIGDKIYFSPMLHFTEKENPFKEDKREYPVDFVFPQQFKYTFTITIPDNYVIESIPTPISIQMQENISSFKYNIVNAGKQVQVNVSLDINYSSIPADYYETLKNFYKTMIEKQNEKVVLRKV